MLERLKALRRRVVLGQMAKFFEKLERIPITRTPAEVGLAYEDISLTATDGLGLKAWFIPSETNDKVVIFNHFLLGNRAGAVPNKDWGNISVDFMPLYKILVDAGYSVFTYDLRNHGASDQAEGNKLGLTNTEALDVLGAVRYVKEHYADSKFYLYSQCYGTVATMKAMEKSPEDFADIEAYVNIQPLTPDGFVTGVSQHMKMEHDDNVLVFSDALKKRTGYSADDGASPAEAVTMPTLVVQVRKDWRTTNESIEDIYERLSTDDKELLWIDDVEERLEGYNYFARKPEKLLEFLASH